MSKDTVATNAGRKAAPSRKLKTIGDIVLDEFKAGNFNVESILKKVHKMRPGASTKAASVYWYANKAGYSIREEASKPRRKRAAGQ